MLATFKFSLRNSRPKEMHKEMLNAANIYLFGIKHTKCKYICRHGGRATDWHSSDRPFNRKTDQRNPIENDHSIQSKNCCNGTIRSLASLKSLKWFYRTEYKICPMMTQFTFFFTDFVQHFSWNLSALSPLTYSSRSAQPQRSAP